MKKNILLCTTALLAGSLFAADSPKDDLKAAAKKLGDSASYSWTSTPNIEGGGGGFEVTRVEELIIKYSK